jgi:hypothetical protein
VLRPTDAVRLLRGHEALAALAEFLEQLKPELYEHRIWSNGALRHAILTQTEPPCRSAGCAAGWAEFIFADFSVGACDTADAMGAFFGIDGDFASEIFGWGDDENPDRRTPQATAARIREVLARVTR